MIKKAIILLTLIPFILCFGSCNTPPPPEECDDFGYAIEMLFNEIEDVPNLKNPALSVHLEKAIIAGMEEDEIAASKELAKFMNIGSQPKYEEIYDMFLDVETTFWTCFYAYNI